MSRDSTGLVAAMLLMIAVFTGSCSLISSEDANVPTPESSTTSTTTSVDTSGAATTVSLDEVAGQLVWRTSSGSIVTSDPDGTNQTFLAVREDAFHTQPTWSNNGQSVAWTSIGRSASSLTIADADGTNLRTTEVSAPPFFLFWSPDDQRLAGLRQSVAGLELFIADTETIDVQPVGPGQPFYVDWLNSDSLAAAVGGSELITIGAADALVERRALPNPLGIFQAPLALPGGDVLIGLDVGASNSLARISSTGDVEILATADGPILMSGHPNDAVVAVLVATAEPQAQVISFATAQQPPDDVPELQAGKVSIVDLERGTINPRPEAAILAMNWSPDGETLAMLQFGQEAATWRFVRDDIVIDGAPFIPSEELAQAYLPFADQYDRSSTWWSPDSKAFVTAGEVDGEAGVWVDVIDDGEPPVNVGLGDVAFWSPR